MRPAKRWTPVLAMLTALLLAGGCGGDDADPEGSATEGATTDAATASDTASPGEGGSEAATATEAGTASGTPEATGTGGGYVVQSGDTLTSIAQEHGTTVEAIVEANGLDDPDVLDVGQELVIPTDG